MSERARILLADDHQEMRTFLTRLLEKDYEIVQTVEDGGACVQAAVRLNPDLCLVDISMPVLNGIQATARLKQSGAKTKVIVLTVYEDDDLVSAAFNSGASGYVLKSKIATDLVHAINEVLAGRTFVSCCSHRGNYSPDQGSDHE